jgi:ComF family protein
MAFPEPLRFLAEGFLELTFPTRCGGCDLPGALLCDACVHALPRIRLETACRRCGAPEGAQRCGECVGATFRFAGARCFGVLEPPLARLVVLYKDGGERRLARTLAALLVEALEGWEDWPDAVVPLPASRAALLRRGFDHGALLTAAVAEFGGWTLLDALEHHGRSDQRRLGRQGRAAHAGHALSVRAGVELPARLLVVDDVFTTGATLDAAAGVLLDGGAEEVRVAAVARACDS